MKVSTNNVIPQAMPEFSSTPASFAVFDGDLDETWATQFGKAKAIAVDTEAMGLIHGRDRLCLVQICDPSDHVACIRINKGQNESKRLKVLMENPGIQKVFHFARFDVAALASGLNIKTNHIFCTKVGSRLARTYSPRHGLKEVIMELVGIELDKQAQSSDWGKVDELSDTQLAYAANDARYLLAAKNKLEQMLKREGRWELAQDCFNCIPVIADLDRFKFTHIFEH